MQQRAIDEARVAQALEMGGALRRGREEGREEGRADERVAIARRMAGEGLEEDFICRVLKVTPEELKRMLA
jgi:predicted transposase YdaD